MRNRQHVDQLRMWGYDFAQAFRSIIRHYGLGSLIVLSLAIGLIFPTIDYALFAGVYQQQSNEFYQADHFYQSRPQMPYEFEAAESVRKKLLRVPGVQSVTYDCNALFSVQSNDAITDIPIAWESAESLRLKKVPDDMIEQLFAAPNRILLTKRYAQRLFDEQESPIGHKVFFGEEEFTVVGVYDGENKSIFPAIDIGHGAVRNLLPVVMAIYLQADGHSADTLKQANAIMRSSDKSSFDDYELYKQDRLGDTHMMFLFTLTICGLLLLFTVLNTVSLLVYKYEKERQKWAVCYAFGASKNNLRRQVYVESCCYSLGSLLFLLPGLWGIRWMLHLLRLELSMEFSALAVAGVFSTMLIVSLCLAWTVLRRIERNNLQRELGG